jgi:predicted lipoprotein with Yx(FWY)xxD motif
MKHIWVLSLTALLLLLAACNTEAITPAPTKTPVTLELKTDATFGAHATTKDGTSLYLFTTDVKDANSSACNDACAATWPAWTLDPTTSDISAGQGVDASKLSTFKRSDGTTQVTYNGWPLYKFSKDAAPGEVNGQGVGGVWFLVSADGKKVLAAAPTGAY